MRRPSGAGAPPDDRDGGGRAELREAASRAPLFATLPAPILEGLIEGAEVSDMPQDAVVFTRGEPAERIYLLMRGQVELFLRAHDGREAVIRIVRPGDTFGEWDVFEPARFSLHARVLKAARVAALPARAFLRALADEPRVAFAFGAHMGLRMRALCRLIGELELRSTAERLGSFLLDLVEGAAPGAEVELPWNKRVLARRLGMKPESLSRAQAALRELGITFQSNRVTVPDVEALRRFCHAEDLSERI